MPPSIEPLKGNTAFENLRKNGLLFRARCFSVRFLLIDAENSPSHFGISASRRAGKAVARNLAKRRLRSLVRQGQEQLPGGIAMVISARREAGRLPWQELLEDWDRFIRHLNKKRIVRDKIEK